MLSSFVVVPGAVDVSHYDLKGDRKQLSYGIRAEYPAQKVLDTIKRKLKQRGWTPQPEDYFNPGLKSSILRGWTYYEDDTTDPRTSVREWQADWRRRSELVTYILEYRCANNGCASTSELRELRIVAIYTAQPDKTYRRWPNPTE
jgi:hypothetical protein